MSKSGVPDWFGKDGGSPTPPPPRRTGSGGFPALLAVVVLAAGGAGAWVMMKPRGIDPAESARALQADEAREAEARRLALLEEVRRAAQAVETQQAPDPSELPSIEEIVAAEELTVEDGSAAEETLEPEAENNARDTQSVMRAVQPLLSEARDCYSEDAPAAHGRVDLTLTIRPDGRVSQVKTAKSGLPATVSSCIAKVISKARFAPAEDTTTTITIPIVFRSAG